MNPEDGNVLIQKLFDEYHITLANKFIQIARIRKPADICFKQMILDAGYIWDEKTHAYLGSRNQAIIAIPGEQFIWAIGHYAKFIKNGEKLQVWLDHRSEIFLEQLDSILNRNSQNIQFTGTGTRGTQGLGEPSPVDDTDKFIGKLKKQAGPKKTLPSNTMIDLGLKARKEKNQKLLDFLKTITPLDENIDIIELKVAVKEIIEEALSDPDFDDEDGKADVDNVMKLADLVWQNPTDVWGVKGRPSRKVTPYRWNIEKSKIHPTGETSYLLTRTQTVRQYRHLIHKGDKWYYLNILPDHTKKWTEVPEEYIKDVFGYGEPKVAEQTGTGAVGPISTPFAFKKGKGKKIMQEKKIQDPTKEEMMDYLSSQFGNEEGFQDDAEVAIYWFSNFNHGGQWSNLYSVLSSSPFSPGPIARGPQPGSSEEMMYQALESEFGSGEQSIDEDMRDDPNYGDELSTDTSLSSVCCGAHPEGEVDNSDAKHPSGICSKCKDHTTFEKNIEEIDGGVYPEITLQMNKMGHVHMWKGTGKIVKTGKYNYSMNDKEADVYFQNDQDVDAILNDLTPSERSEIEKGYTIVTKNIPDDYFQIDEMTGTSAVSGYNIPSFLSKRGGSQAGVDASKNLGYELTAIGKKDMQRGRSKLYQDSSVISETISHEEVVQTWEDDKDGEYILVSSDDRTANYIAHGVQSGVIEPKFGSIWTGIRQWMKSHNFYPNIWSINDHGNLSLWNKNGRYLGGIV